MKYYVMSFAIGCSMNFSNTDVSYCLCVFTQHNLFGQGFCSYENTFT